MSTGYAMAEEAQAKYESDVQPKKKVKKPGFIKRWLLKSVKETMEAERNEAPYPSIPRAPRGLVKGHEGLDSQPLHLKIYRAQGGTIVETTTYDRKTDRSQNQLHVITNDIDLGQGLSKIITMESLRG